MSTNFLESFRKSLAKQSLSSRQFYKAPFDYAELKTVYSSANFVYFVSPETVRVFTEFAEGIATQSAAKAPSSDVLKLDNSDIIEKIPTELNRNIRNPRFSALTYHLRQQELDDLMFLSQESFKALKALAKNLREVKRVVYFENEEIKYELQLLRVRVLMLDNILLDSKKVTPHTIHSHLKEMYISHFMTVFDLKNCLKDSIIPADNSLQFDIAVFVPPFDELSDQVFQELLQNRLRLSEQPDDTSLAKFNFYQDKLIICYFKLRGSKYSLDIAGPAVTEAA